jgi:hypothetical protein
VALLVESNKSQSEVISLAGLQTCKARSIVTLSGCKK